MERIALSFALVLGIAVDVFFAVVNFYPVAPPRTQGRAMHIVADMSESHATWFRTHVIDAFNREHNARLQLRLPNNLRCFQNAICR